MSTLRVKVWGLLVLVGIHFESQIDSKKILRRIEVDKEYGKNRRTLVFEWT